MFMAMDMRTPSPAIGPHGMRQPGWEHQQQTRFWLHQFACPYGLAARHGEGEIRCQHRWGHAARVLDFEFAA